MQYMLMFYEAAATDARAPANFGAWMAYVDAVEAAGISRGGEDLQPRPPPPRCAFTATKARCWTTRLPAPRSSWAASSSSTCPTWTPRWIGQRG